MMPWICYSYNELVLHAWQRVGITPACQSVELFVATASSAAQAAASTMPAYFAPLPPSASAEELRQQMIAMREYCVQLQQSSHQYHLQQEAEITGRLKHMQTQLETRG